MSRLDTFHPELNKMEIMLSLKTIEITTMLDFEVSIDHKNMLEMCQSVSKIILKENAIEDEE